MIRQERTTTAWALALVVILACALPVPAAGVPTGANNDADGPLAPPRVDDDRIGLAEAVRLTLEYDPAIQSAKQDIEFARGQLMTATGQFDWFVNLAPQYSFQQQELRPGQIQSEIDRRDMLRGLRDGFAELRDEIREGLRQGLLVQVECPEGLEPEGSVEEDLDDPNDEDPFGLGTNVIIRGGGFDELTTAFLQVCKPSDPFGPSQSFLDLLEQLNEDTDGQIETDTGIDFEDILSNNIQVTRGQLELAENIADAISERAGISLNRIGEVPHDEETNTLSLSNSWRRQWRNGVSTVFDVTLQTSERNYQGKSLDASYGGLGIPNQFPSSATVDLDVPLGRGGARVSVGASEQAAMKSVEAQQDLLRFAMTGEAFRTVLAYLDLRSSEEVLALLEQSADRQQRILEQTQALIDDGELPQVDIERSNARVAQVRGAVEDARLGVIVSRIVLANAIGLDVADLTNAPLTAERFAASVADYGLTSVMLDQAVGNRRDRQALENIREANKIITDAARYDVRREASFFVSAGMSTLYESPVYRVLPDERLPLRDEESFVNYDDPTGLYRAFKNEWNPFIQAGFQFNFPFKNNVGKGRLAQSMAQFVQADIQAGDIERQIRDNVALAAGALERAARVVDRNRAAVAAQQKTLEAAYEFYDEGELNLVDILLTEEDLTSQRIQLVRAQLVQLMLLARLKFESGTLLDFLSVGDVDEIADFDPGEFVSPS